MLLHTSGKCTQAIKTLKPDTQIVIYGHVNNEEDFNNNVKWITGTDESGSAILTNINPHSEITYAKVKTEMDKIQTEFDDSITKTTTDKASANAKLKALGLTDDEIEAITK